MRLSYALKASTHVWSAVDVDLGELLALEASYGRSCLNALTLLKKALKKYTNKPLVAVDRDHGIDGPLRGLDWNTCMRGSSDT
jgi:transposase-like protein